MILKDLFYPSIVKSFILIIMLVFCSRMAVANQPTSLTAIEKNIAESITTNSTAELDFLEKIVNINSGTDNPEGVYAVGNLVKNEFEKLGFTGEWKNLPTEMGHAGTLILSRQGNQGMHLLLIGHLDTVFHKDSSLQKFTQKGNVATGPGIADDKGGVALILFAMKALYEQKVLDNTNITIALVGDEENSGKPTSISRAPLINAAKNVDVALDFEPALNLKTATIARRGVMNWEITATGIEAHSASMFNSEIGYGAIFELSRILNTAREKFAEQNFTFNPGMVIGGTAANINDRSDTLTGYGKNNIIAKVAKATGDMRFISNEQQMLMKSTLLEITKDSLPKTKSTITFQDAIPAMPSTENNLKLLAMYSQASEDLGFSRVVAFPPELRGAADISHVAHQISANLSGLGPVGYGIHTTNEKLEIPSLTINTQRAALLIYRLTRSGAHIPEAPVK